MKARVTYHSEPPERLLEFVPAEQEVHHPVPPSFREQLLVDTVHDGEFIPARFLESYFKTDEDRELLLHHFQLERDWGANLVAQSLSSALGLGGYYKVNIARVLLDFARFPGVTGKEADHLRRYAINYPFSDRLSFEEKKELLETYYDHISNKTDGMVRGRILKVAVHTYDKFNSSGTLRPPISLVNRPIGYQNRSQMPVGVFDPLYPDVLGEFTSDRSLMSRISLTLEREGLPVAFNYPYCLPEGSVEVRSQVWFFFDYLQQRFTQDFPDTAEQDGYQRVWSMLKDTNLRSSDSQALKGHIHMFWHPPAGQELVFEQARQAYRHLQGYLDGHPTLLREYRYSPSRPSSLGIEVRKDLVWTFSSSGPEGVPLAPRPESAARIARLLAKGISTYLREDRRRGPLEPDPEISQVVPHSREDIPQLHRGLREIGA